MQALFHFLKAALRGYKSEPGSGYNRGELTFGQISRIVALPLALAA